MQRDRSSPTWLASRGVASTAPSTTLEPDAPDAALHAIRILAKRARYAVDAVAPLYGKDARRFARALADVQTVLGEYQDTTVAEAWLRSAAKALPSTRLVAGELIAFERDDRVRLRAEFGRSGRRPRAGSSASGSIDGGCAVRPVGRRRGAAPGRRGRTRRRGARRRAR